MAARDTLKVAAAQYPIDQLASRDAWRSKIARWVAEGAATGAEVLLFPEYAAIEQASFLGADVSGDLEATLKAVADLERERTALHLDLAAQHNVHIIVGSGPKRKSDGQYVNAAQLVTPAGSIGEQEKIIMTPFERDWGISPGARIRIFETALGRFGIAICYDSEFPVLVRAMAEVGAEVIMIPSCTERLSGYQRVRTGARARALENQIATVMSPTVGDALWSPAVDRNAGAAGIYIPSEQSISDDGILAEGTVNQTEWVCATIDLAHLRRIRTEGEMRNFADWQNQPGAPSLNDKVDIVTLN